MSIAYFDDTATLRIADSGGEIRRTVTRVKVDYTRGEKKDRAVMYIPLYHLRDMTFVSEKDWEDSGKLSGTFTVRPGDRFDYVNNGENGSTPTGSVSTLTVTEVKVNTRGSHRMRHIKVIGEKENE